MKDSIRAAITIPVMVPLDVTIEVEPEPTPGWFPTLVVGPDMMMVCGEEGSKSDEELDEPKEELV